MRRLGILLFGLVGLVNTSHAALNDLGNGLVNDTTLNITWMKDANLFKTLCDASDPIATGFTPVDAASATAICASGGVMSWDDAEAWMVRLNAQSYLGHNNWRQPATVQPDLTCESTLAGGGNGGYNCTGSELGNLYNVSLGNPNFSGTGTGLDGSTGTIGTLCTSCFQNTAPFINTRSESYWSGDEYAPVPTAVWIFGTYFGEQTFTFKNVSLPVWPVRSGLSAIAPITPQQVPTLSVWGLGIMSLLLAFVARRKAR